MELTTVGRARYSCIPSVARMTSLSQCTTVGWLSLSTKDIVPVLVLVHVLVEEGRTFDPKNPAHHIGERIGIRVLVNENRPATR
jgi:hypothetical protein